MSKAPEPPKAYQEFIRRYPKLGEAWDAITAAGEEGPLDQRVLRLVKLAIAVGALREGAIHSSVRKAIAAGVTIEEIEQVVALAAGTLGLPSTVAVDTWIKSELRKSSTR